METILWQSLPVVITIAIPTLLFLAGWLAKKAGAKLDLSQKTELNNLLYNVVVQGIAYAEQIAKKKQSDNETLNGQSKMYIATQYIVDQLKEYNIDNIAATEIQRRVEAALGTETIIENMGAAGIGNMLGGLLEGDDNEDNFDTDN